MKLRDKLKFNEKLKKKDWRLKGYVKSRRRLRD